MVATLPSRRLQHARLWFDVGTVAVALIFYAVAWPTLFITHQVAAAAAPFIAGFAAFPLLLARVNPALGWAISAGAALVIALAIPNRSGEDIPFQVVHLLCLFALLFAVAVRSGMQIVLVAWLATALLMGTTMASQGDEFATSGFGWPIAVTGIVLLGLMVRWLTQSRQALLAQSEETELERARRAILEEKARIARDLHDVVAHHMSMVVVQAQTAPYRIDGLSAAARAEFEAIGVGARAALNEIRGLLGVLRSDGQLPEHAPQPTAMEVPDLLEGARRAGMALTTEIDGPLTAIPDATGLALYRIVQESLANASRHAPGAPVRVRIVAATTAVTLTVTNDAATQIPTAPRSPHDTPGSGITGMQSRAQAAGGHLTATPHPDGTFEVHAHLPIDT
ncbi:sensor histidine kinase [Nocardia otitidiscaviarum]|uniref:sensor histidine kinase n=1 Tax=Nocardia otitidiscaviarum TaxID=1823 RepID=UPI0004A6C2DA|nr:histidine kinase [Nocardia otitidiscaviarum]MBF6132906.1 sensor histidine kinase [Nocardia otitidiscaviarum]MBF6238856.1 sensor histidine kinase [Nocardia otitidiscaviarum]MBF6486301.1 sensor histidine kinase [Nocardia otitidiscaviarum]